MNTRRFAALHFLKSLLFALVPVVGIKPARADSYAPPAIVMELGASLDTTYSNEAPAIGALCRLLRPAVFPLASRQPAGCQGPPPRPEHI